MRPRSNYNIALQTILVFAGIAALQIETASADVIYSSNDNSATSVGMTGDGNVTVDPNTSLMWLDASITLGLSSSEVTQRLADVNSGFFGYRFATGAEIETFWTNAGIAITPVNPGYVPGQSEPTERLFDLTGMVQVFNAQGQSQRFLILNLADSGLNMEIHNQATLATVDPGFFGASQGDLHLAIPSRPISDPGGGSENVGAALVRDFSSVPEPAILPQLATVAALLYCRRRGGGARFKYLGG
jgi:hypothetical protein